MVLEKVLAVALAADIVLPFAPKGDLETGWQTTDGQSWYFIQEDGECVVSDWVTVDGKKYYCDSTGRMVFDIDNYRIDGVGYDFDAKGVCTNPDAASKKIAGWQKMAYSDTKYDPETKSDIFVEYDYKWYFYDDDGSAVKGWKKIDNKWYYFDRISPDPRMYSSRDDWRYYYYIDNNYYFFKTSGEMVTGWYFDGLAWHYARTDGKLYIGEWYQENGNWYYFSNWSEMFAGVENVKIDGIYYSFDSNGVCTNPDAKAEKIVGWSKEYYSNYSYNWYYYDENGEMVTGWKSISGKWYYFDDEVLNGAMVCDGAWYIDHDTYCFDDTGAMVVDGWYNNYSEGQYSEWYYIVNGKAYRGWKQIDGVWYFFGRSQGAMAENQILSIDGKKYRFSDSGAMYVGWSSYLNKGGTTLWWYSAPDGALYVDQWLNQNGNWYYFGSDAEMVANVEDYEINGISYSFDSNGVCTNPDAALDKITGWDKKEIAEGVYEWYYYDENGETVTGWQEIDGKWYYFDPETAIMNAGNILTINGKKYRFAKDGAMYIGWSSYLNKAGETLWWYSAPDGSLFVSKWLNQNGNWYYFGADAEMVAYVKDYEIDGVFYTFDENGVCQNP